MKVAVVSDLHGVIPDMEWSENPELLILAGDIFPHGLSSREQGDWIYTKFNKFINSLDIECILVPGNHDGWFLGNVYTSNRNLMILKNNSYNYISRNGEEWKIFGTSWCKLDGSMSFMTNDTSLSEKYELIPEGLDILVSHDTPRYLEFSPILNTEGKYDLPSGNPVLMEYIEKRNPKYSFCGHIHYPTNEFWISPGGTKVMNVSQRCDKRNTGIIKYLELGK